LYIFSYKEQRGRGIVTNPHIAGVRVKNIIAAGSPLTRRFIKTA
jgi:hypothetical protein